jgi:hypothetical protein
MLQKLNPCFINDLQFIQFNDDDKTVLTLNCTSG